MGALGQIQMGASLVFPSRQPLVGQLVFWSGFVLLLLAVGCHVIQLFASRGRSNRNSALPQDIEKMPLADAARIAYQVLGSTYFGVSAARFGARPNDILLFYCFHIARLVPLYGKFVPSTELVRLSYGTVLDLKFSIKNGSVHASELIGSNIYVDLAIDKKSLRLAIEHLKFVAVERTAA